MILNYLKHTHLCINIVPKMNKNKPEANICLNSVEIFEI